MTSTPDPLEVASALHSAAIHLLRRVRRVDDESGLSAARLSALSVLVFGGPRTVGQLARAEQVSAPTMSRLLSGLERDGLVLREPSSRDGRSVVAHATPAGRRVLEEGRHRRVGEVLDLLTGLSSDELRILGSAAELIERVSAFSPSAGDVYAPATAERRWSGLADDSSGSGGASG